MALFAPLIPFIKGALAVAGTAATVASVVQGREAAKEAEQANRLNRLAARMTQARNIRRAVAASRVAQGQITAGATQLGTQAASATAGARASEAAQTAGGIAFAGSQFGLADRRFSAMGRQVAAEGRASTFAAGAKLATAASGFTPGQFFESVWDRLSSQEEQQ